MIKTAIFTAISRHYLLLPICGISSVDSVSNDLTFNRILLFHKETRNQI